MEKDYIKSVSVAFGIFVVGACLGFSAAGGFQKPTPKCPSRVEETFIKWQAKGAAIDGIQQFVPIGATKDNDAVEFNKKVEQCEISNGEFHYEPTLK